MLTGPFMIFDRALVTLIDGSKKPLDETSLTAVLLNASYVPDIAVHSRLADVSAYEITGGDYARRPITGALIEAMPGAALFKTDTISWGNPVTLPPVKYLAICYGAVGALTPESSLLGVMDLAIGTPSVEAIRAGFQISPPATGWFALARSQ